MTILHQPCKREFVPLAVLIMKEEKPDAKFQYFNKNIINTHYALLEIPKQKLAKIFQSKREAFCIKITF